MTRLEREKLKEIFIVLDNYLGDSDPMLDEDMTDAEIKDEEPIFWVTKEISSMIN